MGNESEKALGELVRDQILKEYRFDERRHVLEEEYRSDTSHQDGDLPYRLQIAYEDGGPSYCVNDYFPHFHYQTGAVLANENYDLLTEYWGTRDTSLDDLEVDSGPIDTLVEEGAVDNIYKLGLD